jgi:membrane-associated phospholipid phosphatase
VTRLHGNVPYPDRVSGVQNPVARPGRVRVRALAVQDWLLLGYFVLLALALAGAHPHPGRVWAMARWLALFFATAAAITAARGILLRRPPLAGIVYRTAILVSLPASYLQLRAVLPIVNPAAHDATLHAIDIWLWGGDPVVWLDRFVTPATTEWFAFVYSGYFAFLAAYVLPLLVTRRSLLRAEAGIGLILICTIGHLLYAVVPGFGPYRAFPDAFPTPLPPGPWLDAVRATVRSTGALKDIFPSIHTAASVYLLLFTLRHRRARPFDLIWPATAFVTANLVVATVFLRWHYVTDVIAGLALALAAHLLAPRIARRETASRARRGLDEVWPPLGTEQRASAASVVSTAAPCASEGDGWRARSTSNH